MRVLGKILVEFFFSNIEFVDFYRMLGEVFIRGCEVILYGKVLSTMVVSYGVSNLHKI